MNTETIAQEVANYRADYIQDMLDVEYYVHEENGHRDFDVDAVIARVAEILGVAR